MPLNHRNEHSESKEVRKQRNMLQTKEQDRTSEKELDKTGLSSLPEKDFKAIIMKIPNLRGECMNPVSTLTKR